MALKKVYIHYDTGEDREKRREKELGQIKKILPGLNRVLSSKKIDAILLAGDIKFSAPPCARDAVKKSAVKNNPIDALLITKNTIVLLELKDYKNGRIVRTEQDELLYYEKSSPNPLIVKGGKQPSVIQQVITTRNGSEDKAGVIDYLYYFLKTQCEQKGQTPNFKRIRVSNADKDDSSTRFPVFVIFNGDKSNCEIDVGELQYKWLHIVNNETFIDDLPKVLENANKTKDNTVWPINISVDKLVEGLGFTSNGICIYEELDPSTGNTISGEVVPPKQERDGKPIVISLVAIIAAVCLIGFAIYKAVDAFRHPSEEKRIENTEVRTSPKAEQSYQDGIRAYQDGDMTEAAKCFAKASGKGHVKAAYNLGLMYYNDGKFDDALSLFKQAADSDDRDALFYLGVMYMEGKGVLKDSAKALNYWKKAIEKGSTEAMYSVGECYYTLKNYTEALPYFKAAASLGHAPSMYIMSVFYDYGLGGLPRDPSQARTWENRALANGYVPYR